MNRLFLATSFSGHVDVVYAGKVFHITDRTDKKQYDEAAAYGISIGIPDYQVAFSPHLKQWER